MIVTSIILIQAFLGIYFVGRSISVTITRNNPQKRFQESHTIDWFKLALGIALFLTAYWHYLLIK